MSPSGLLSLTTLEVQSLLISLASQSSKRYNWQVCRYSGKGLVRFITPEIPNTGGQSSFSITPRFITPWMLHFEVSSWFRFWLFNPTSRDHKASPVHSDAKFVFSWEYFHLIGLSFQDQTQEKTWRLIRPEFMLVTLEWSESWPSVSADPMIFSMRFSHTHAQ